MSIYGLSSVKAPTKVIAEEVLAYLEHNGTPLRPHPDTGVPVVWGYSPGAEHGTGRALDFMVTSDTSVGNVIADYVWANRERFGLIHVIWRQRIRSTQVSPGQWRGMSDRGSPTENHMDHPHCFFDGRAVKGKSFGGSGGAQSVKPKPSTSKPKPSSSKAPKFPLPRGHWYGVQSSNPKNHSGYYAKDRAGIKQWQQQMKRRGWSIGVDGIFGVESQKVCRAFQSEKRIRVDGAVGAQTWTASWTEPVT